MPSVQIVAYRLNKQEHPVDIEPTGPFEPSLTIEQLAADYRAKLAIAQQAQEEADSHRCAAEAALEKLVASGKALGFVLSVDAPEAELMIADWRDLRVGDVVWISDGNSRLPSGEYEIDSLADDELQPFMIRWDGQPWWPNTQRRDWRFIRRP